MEKKKKSKGPTKVSFLVKVPEVRRELKMVDIDMNCLLREVEIQICDKLGVDPLETILAITLERQEQPLEQSSTIKRCKIGEGSVLTLKVVQTTTAGRQSRIQLSRFVPELEVHEKAGSTYKYSPFGLMLEGYCQNEMCVKYGKELLIPMGVGQFNFKKVMKGSRCPACPYKDRKLDPEIKVAALRFSHCMWRYDGDYLDHSDFLHYDYAKEWYRVEDEDNAEFYALIGSRRWVDMNIYVRPI